MFTLAVETQSIGCDVRVLMPYGFAFSKGKGFGLREGYMGQYEYMEHVLTLPPIGGTFELDFTPAADDRKKSYCTKFREPADYDFLRQCFSVQACIGLSYGARVGVELDEILDFVLGWTTLDIMGDDRSANTNTVNSTTSPTKN
jgi:hypothetical protein